MHRPVGGCVICFRGRQAGRACGFINGTGSPSGQRAKRNGRFKATCARKRPMRQPGFGVLAGNCRWRDFELMEQVFLTQTIVATS